MRKPLLVPLLFLLAFALQANSTELDDLKRLMASRSGEAKVDCMNDIAAYHVQNNELNQANEYAQDAMALAKEHNYKLGIATAHDNFGLVFQSKFDYTNAVNSFYDALNIRNAEKNQKGIATSHNNIGRAQFLQENMDNAEESLVLALKLRTEINDIAGASETYQNLGDVYLFKKIYGKAQDHFRQSMDMRLQLNDVKGAAEIANYLGQINNDLGDYDGALVYYNMSLGLNTSIEDMSKIAADYTNVANVNIAQGAFDEALDMNKQAYEIRKGMNDELGMAECYKNFGVIYQGLGNKSKASQYLAESSAMLKKLGTIPGAQNIYKEISTSYQKLGDYPNAYKSQLAYSKTREMLFSEEKAKTAMELSTKYESAFQAEKKQQEIAELKQKEAFNQKKSYFLMGLIGLAGMTLFSMFIGYKRKKKDNELLRNKNEEINRQKEEIDVKAVQLEETNSSLDVLNQKLVTEMAERESIEQSSFARDRFLATMSHEMRTPMNIIIGLTHMLLEEKPREDQVEHLRTLQFSANNLVVFINDVLDFSKIEAGKLNLESRLFSVEQTVAEVNKRFDLPARDKGLTLNCVVDNKVPTQLNGDPARLNQILTNLVSNAIKFTDHGEINMNVKLEEMTKDKAVLLLRVQDTGKGIEKEQLENMFKKFSRTSNDIFEGYAASGLGLAITKRLVELQNGKMEVESIQGKGTTFKIYLTYKLVKETELAKGTAKTSRLKKVDNDVAKNYGHLENNRILLVEDNKINQLVVAKMLRKLGIEVITADNGVEALKVYDTVYFDLVLMDIQMPEMDGYRATAEIRKSPDPRKANVPIIALTASAFLTEKEKAKLFGMNDHVGKPFGPDDLLDKISSCLMIHKESDS